MRVVAFVPDLMDRSKVSAMGDVSFVTASELEGATADLVIVDVSRLSDLSVLASVASPRIIGFASHVDRDVMDKALAAGCTEVLARSVFFNRVARS